MGLKDLFFSITARDKTGSAFSSVNKKLRETGAAAATASERIDRVGQRMRKAGAAGSVASVGIAALFRDSIGLYDEQARAEAKVAQAIKATGGAAGFTAEELKRQASALQGITRFGDERILNDVTAQLLTFKEISGDTFTRAQTAALDLATTLDGDLKSASIMLGKALNDPAKGLSAMSRAGVTFTETQQEVIKGLAKSGQIAQAQKLILDEIASAYGGQAEAARKAGTGILEAWSNTWGDLKEIVGGALLDVLRVIVPPLESAVQAFQGLPAPLQKGIVYFGALAVALPPVIAALGLVAAGVAAIGAPVSLAIAGVAALTAAFVALWPEIRAGIDWIGTKFTAAWTAAGNGLVWLGEKADGLQRTFLSVFTAIPQFVIGAIQKIAEWVEGKFFAIMDGLGAKVEWVEGKFAWLYDRVVGNSWVPDMIEEIGKEFTKLSGLMVKPTDDASGKVSGTFESLGQDVGSQLADLAASGKASWSGLWSSMLDIGSNYASRIVSNVFGKLADGLSKSLGTAGSGTGGGFLASFGSSFLSGIGSALSGAPGFATGGEFTVGGRAGIDRNFAAVRLSDGERVKVLRRGDTGGDRPINVYIQTSDPSSFAASRVQIAGQLRSALATAQRGA